MTFGAYVNSSRGSTQAVAADVPNGPAVLERLVEGKSPYLVRGGSFQVENGGFSKEDAEVPFGVPLTYRVTVGVPDRVVQRNLVLTPTLRYGQQGWRAGAGRVLTLDAGTSGSTPVVAGVGSNSPGSSPVYQPPVVVGSVSTSTSGSSYTLTPSASVALGDWLYLVHHQVGADSTPPVPSGWHWLTRASTGDVDVTVWRRKRVAGDGGVTVTAAAAGVKLGLLLWVRGASDAFVPTVAPVAAAGNAQTMPLPTAPVTLRPTLLLAVVASRIGDGLIDRTDRVDNVTQTFTSDSGLRHTTVGAVGLLDAGIPPLTPAVFPARAAAYAVGVQIMVSSDAPVTQRIIATTPVAPMAKSGRDSRLTGRVKFRTPDLWLWQDAKDRGSWSDLRSTTTSWANVKSRSSTAGADYMRLYVDLVYSYSNVTTLPGTSAAWAAWVATFTGSNRAPLTAVTTAARSVLQAGVATPEQRDLLVSTNPGELVQLLLDLHTTPTRSAFLLSGAIPLSSAGQPVVPHGELAVAVIAADAVGLPVTAAGTTVPAGTVITQTYVAPRQVIVADAARTNTWVDFSFRFPLSADVPPGAVLRFMHGPNVREFATSWQFDRIGITSGDDMVEHAPMYYMDGDSLVPAQPEDYLLPEGIWTAALNDASITWSGDAGNSVSVFTGPSRVYAEAATQIDIPAAPVGYRQPVYINDPIAPARGHWYELITISDLTYAARRDLLDILGRGPQIPVSSTRGWAAGSITILTRDLSTRMITLATFQAGRVLLFRNPDPRYPEDTWYVSVGDLVEQRLPEGDQRRGERLWQIPFVQVERPVGLIEQAAGRTWGQVRDEWADWDGVRRANDTWLELLYPTNSSPPVIVDVTLYPGGANAYPSLATFPSSAR